MKFVVLAMVAAAASEPEADSQFIGYSASSLHPNVPFGSSSGLDPITQGLDPATQGRDSFPTNTYINDYTPYAQTFTPYSQSVRPYTFTQPAYTNTPFMPAVRTVGSPVVQTFKHYNNPKQFTVYTND